MLRTALLALALLLIGLPSLRAQGERLSPQALVELARAEPESERLREALVATLGVQRLRAGTAHAGHGPDFVWAIESKAEPRLVVDELAPAAARRLPGSDLWLATGKLATGRNHSYHWLVDGRRTGGDFNVAAYAPDSYEQPGVPRGTLTGPVTHVSKIYDGMESQYWVYVPAGYDGSAPAAVMVWNDGGGHVDRNSPSRTQIVVDNLTHKKKIPVIVHVFINPGDISKAAGTPTHDFVSAFSRRTGRSLRDSMRSTEYDTVSDRYVRMLEEEVLAEVGGKWRLRKDGYSRAIVGDSSGAIAAFNAAWQRTDLFSRVLSRIGTYTSIQWQPGVQDGGNIFPFLIRKSPRRNIRVWLSGGAEDLENEHGSWPLQNIQMANSLKMAGYDFHFTWSGGSHSGAHGHAEAPEALTWLWRDYDPARSEQVYEQDPAEKTKPYFRVRSLNR